MQLSQLEVVPAPAGGARTVEVSATFMGDTGTLKTVTAPVENMPGVTNSQGLTANPIEPNESRRVSIYVARPPTGWNHPGEITVENVSATTP